MLALIITSAIGIVFVYLGIMTLNGTYKKWYLGPKIYPPQAWMYGQIPLGIGSLWMSFGVLIKMIFELEPDVIADIVLAGLVPAYVSAVVLAMWRPRWIKPSWVNWLEDNHSWLELEYLISDARKNPEVWVKRVSTQNGLESWARKVLNKHPEPGDEVVWCKNYGQQLIEATVIKNTDKRVKIKYHENGQILTRYVQPNSLTITRSEK